MNVDLLRQALDDADCAHDRLAAGECLLASVLNELPGNDPLQEQLRYLIDAQKGFRLKADEAVQRAWAEVLGKAKGGEP